MHNILSAARAEDRAIEDAVKKGLPRPKPSSWLGGVNPAAPRAVSVRSGHQSSERSLENIDSEHERTRTYMDVTHVTPCSSDTPKHSGICTICVIVGTKSPSN